MWGPWHVYENGSDSQKEPEPFIYLMERATGIEPASSAWKAEVLPLNHTRVLGGATGVEPATLCSQSRCATKLRHAPGPPVQYRRAVWVRQTTRPRCTRCPRELLACGMARHQGRDIPMPLTRRLSPCSFGERAHSRLFWRATSKRVGYAHTRRVGRATAPPPPPHTATKKGAHARGVGAQSQSPLSATPLLLGSLERGLDLLLGLELEDPLGQRIGLGLCPLGDDLARAQD